MLAHAGHWILNVVYVVPLIGFGIFLAYTWWKRRHEVRGQQDDVPQLPGDPAED